MLPPDSLTPRQTQPSASFYRRIRRWFGLSDPPRSVLFLRYDNETELGEEAPSSIALVVRRQRTGELVVLKRDGTCASHANLLKRWLPHRNWSAADLENLRQSAKSADPQP